MCIASRPDGQRYMAVLIATVMLVLGAASIHVNAADNNRGASAIAALDAIPADDWLKQSSGALLDRVIAASSKQSLDAAAATDPRAQALVGSAHLSGMHGYAKSEAEAVKFYRLAADSSAIAQNNLASLLLSGVANGGTPAPTEAAEMFRRAAKQGHPVAQLNLGRLYANGNGVEKDEVKAKEFLSQAAAQGNSDATTDLFLLEKREEAEEWKQLEAAAATGDAGAVKKLAAAYAEVDQQIFDLVKTNQLQATVNAVSRAPDPKRLRYLEVVDEHGMTALHWTVRHRNAAGLRWLLDKGAALELKDNFGRTPLKIALDQVDTRAMSMLIDRGARTSTALPGHDEKLKALRKTDDIVEYMIWANAPAVAAEVYQKACSTEEPINCRRLGLRYYNGEGVPKDLAKAATLFSTGCDRGDVQACYNIGVAHALGEGVPKDEVKAAAFYTKACDGGIFLACTHLGYRYQNGLGVTKDVAKAAPLYRKACSAGEPTACLNLGLLYNQGEGVAPDKAMAATLLAKACALGEQKACTQQTAAAPTNAAPASAQPTTAAKPAPGACQLVRVQLGVDTVASVERDIKARGGEPITGGTGLAKFRISAMSGDYRDAGTGVMAVNYDFDSTGPSGRLAAMIIVNHADSAAGFDQLLAARRVAAAAAVGPLQQKSETEFVATSPNCKLRFLPNAGTWFIHEVYELAK